MADKFARCQENRSRESLLAYLESRGHEPENAANPPGQEDWERHLETCGGCAQYARWYDLCRQLARVAPALLREKMENEQAPCGELSDEDVTAFLQQREKPLDAALDGRCRRHLEQCAGCRRWVQACMDWEDGRLMDADVAAAPISPGVELVPAILRTAKMTKILRLMLDRAIQLFVNPPIPVFEVALGGDFLRVLSPIDSVVRPPLTLVWASDPGTAEYLIRIRSEKKAVLFEAKIPANHDSDVPVRFSGRRMDETIEGGGTFFWSVASLDDAGAERASSGEIGFETVNEKSGGQSDDESAGRAFVELLKSTDETLFHDASVLLGALLPLVPVLWAERRYEVIAEALEAGSGRSNRRAAAVAVCLYEHRLEHAKRSTDKRHLRAALTDWKATLKRLCQFGPA